jgi:flagellar export protein FliJ
MDAKQLKRLLELKRRLEKVKKGELAEARQERDRAQAALEAAHAEQRARLADLQGENLNLVSVDELADRARFVVLAGQQVGVARERVDARDAVVLEAEEARVLATRDVRTFELLSERNKDEKRLLEKRLEQGAADEFVSSRRSMK